MILKLLGNPIVAGVLGAVIGAAAPAVMAVKWADRAYTAQQQSIDLYASVATQEQAAVTAVQAAYEAQLTELRTQVENNASLLEQAKSAASNAANRLRRSQNELERIRNQPEVSAWLSGAIAGPEYSRLRNAARAATAGDSGDGAGRVSEPGDTDRAD